MKIIARIREVRVEGNARYSVRDLQRGLSRALAQLPFEQGGEIHLREVVVSARPSAKSTAEATARALSRQLRRGQR